MKKLLAMALVVVLSFGLVGCGNSNTETGATPSGEAPAYKIGILTGTVSQGEEEFRAAEKMKAQYPDMIVTATYPDNFMTETETTIAQFMSLASDENVKAIIMTQAVPGASAAIDKARELRGDDLLVICGVPGEDPDMIASKADLVWNSDEVGQGRTIAEQAKAMGAETFVHYSFPRHMSYQTLATRRDLLKENCEALGIKFVEATSPDPTSDAGVPGTQQFILEDIPRKVAEYGEKTAFFGTNCAMQEPMIKAIIETGALYPQQCCASPFHGYPGALGIEIPTEKQGDVDYIIEQITAKATEKGANGRLATWPVPMNMLFVEGGVEYAMAYLDGETNGKVDVEKIQEIAGEKIILTPYTNAATGETFENYLWFLSEYVTF